MRLWPRRWPASRWKRVLAVLGLLAGYGFLLLILLGLAGFLYFRSEERREGFFQALLAWQFRPFPATLPLAATALSPAPEQRSTGSLSAEELFQTTQVWRIHLRFTSNQWVAMSPRQVPPYHQGLRGATFDLRNPHGGRPGVLGLLGFELPWSQAREVEFADLRFPRVAARYKGNGTFLEAMGRFKRSFKLRLDKHAPRQSLAGRTILNLNNLVADSSYLRETLAYEYYRAAGVPASRTAFADVILTIEEVFEKRRLGLYGLVENPDEEWAKDHFGMQRVALFKPVMRSFLHYLGDHWEAYQPAYAPKTKITQQEQSRVIEFARLVSQADDEEFRRRLDQFLDLDQFARFLAVEVLLSNYDGILTHCQNFLVYLDPRTERFGFIPWDLDHSWGEFAMVGTEREREQASIWRPWSGENRFLERLMAVASFKERYRAELERQLRELFIPERLARRIDELATVARPVITAESSERLLRFEDSLQAGDSPTPSDQRPPYRIKRFIEIRADSVRQQLDGRTLGLIPTRQSLFQ